MFNGSMVGFGVEEIYDNLCAGNSRKSWYNCPRISKLAKAAQSKKHFPTISDGTMMDEVCQKREREGEKENNKTKPSKRPAQTTAEKDRMENFQFRWAQRGPGAVLPRMPPTIPHFMSKVDRSGRLWKN